MTGEPVFANVLVVIPVRVFQIRRGPHSPDHWPYNPPELRHVAVLRRVEVVNFAEAK